MKYRYISEGYFDTIDKSKNTKISVEDTKVRTHRRTVVERLAQFKEDYANPDGIVCSYIVDKHDNFNGIYTQKSPNHRLVQLIQNILCCYFSHSISNIKGLYEYSHKYNNPKTDEPLIAITQEDIINTNLKIINQLFAFDENFSNKYPLLDSGLYLTCNNNIFLYDFDVDNIPITFRLYLHIEDKDGQIKFIGRYLRYFKAFWYKLKFDNPDIDLKDKEVLEYFYNEIDAFNIHYNNFCSNDTIITIKEILLPKIINAGLALNMSYDEILEDVNSINERTDKYIRSSDKIYQYMIFESKYGQKLLSDVKQDLMSLKALLESKIGVPVNISFNFLGNDWTTMRKIDV